VDLMEKARLFNLYCIASVSIGKVLAHLDKLPAASHVQQLLGMPAVGDIIPCESRGVAWELHVLEGETGLHTRFESDLDLALLGKSAGPATCVVVTSREPLAVFGGSFMKLGSLTRI
jgi:hypothetical protein